jgi:hypothetical protein
MGTDDLHHKRRARSAKDRKSLVIVENHYIYTNSVEDCS